MEIEIDGEYNIGEIEIECPLCKGSGGPVHMDLHDAMLKITICPLCLGNKKIVVDAGEQYVSGMTEIDPPDCSWRD